MATKPTDLTSKTWNKVKGLTVPKTGLGAKLDAYQAAKTKTEQLQTRNLAAFSAAADALQAITKHLPEAEKKCNKTLHKDTITALAAYKPLIATEGAELHNAFVKYQGYVDKYKHLREVCGKEMAVIERQMEAAAKSAIDEVTKSISENDLPEAIKQAKAAKEELAKIQTLANESIAKPRVPGPAIETPHADDRPDASVFTALINKQNDIIGIRTNAEHKLTDLLKHALPKATVNN